MMVACCRCVACFAEFCNTGSPRIALGFAAQPACSPGAPREREPTASTPNALQSCGAPSMGQSPRVQRAGGSFITGYFLPRGEFLLTSRSHEKAPA